MDAAQALKQTRPRRRNGEGTVYFDKAKNRHIGEVVLGYRDDGKVDRRRVSGATESEAWKALKAIIREHEKGTLVSSGKARETVAGFLAHYLETVQPDLRASTWRRYGQFVNLHIAPVIGRKQLTALRPDDVKLLLAHKRKEMSPRSLRQLYAVLRRALELALRWEYVARNVADAVQAPTFRRFQPTMATPEQMHQLIQAAKDADDYHYPLWVLALHSGCRRGELLGLEWKHINLDTGLLSVQQTLESVTPDGLPVIGETKNDSSRRNFTIDADAMAVIREHRQRQLARRLALGPDYPKHHDLVFASPIGEPLRARNVVRSYKAALRRASLPESLRFHDLRHAHATMLLEAGVSLKVVSSRLGHSTIAITADIYSHVLASRDATTAEQFAAVMRNAAR